MNRTLRTLASMAFVALSSFVSSGCPGPAPEDGTDLYRLAVNGAPGGSLLSVWGVSNSEAWLAGGFVGVDPARLAGTMYRPGRLVEYGPGRFTTRCRTDAVLWWTHGLTDDRGVRREVWAAGDNGTVLRYRNNTCEVLPLGITFPEGAPTIWGLWAQAENDVWFVGGSPTPTGPKGVLIHWDGAAFTRVDTLPEFARSLNLYKISRLNNEYVIVGERGAVLRGNGTSWESLPVPYSTSDNRLFTASCYGGGCIAVGGTASGLVLTTRGSELSSMAVATDMPAGMPGLNGVFAPDSTNVFVVGTNGFTMHLQQRFAPGYFSSYVSPARTPATLHGVGGTSATILAVGGELDDRSPTQRAVVLVRGDGAERFNFDGVTYNATGALRSSLGGAGQF